MSINCPNCREDIHGKYCQHCGQLAHTRRITWRHILEEMQSAIFGFDNKFLRTVKHLTFKPEHVIKSIIAGVRVSYFGPLSYYFILITIMVLTISLFDIDMVAYSRSINNSLRAEDSGGMEFQNKVNENIFANFKLWSFFMIPFFILSSWLVFKNKKYNYLETSVMVFYAMGHPIIISILLLVSFKALNFTIGMVLTSILTYTYFAWVCMRFYDGNKWWNFVKGWIALVLGLIILMVVFMVIFIIALIVNPQLMEMMK